MLQINIKRLEIKENGETKTMPDEPLVIPIIDKQHTHIHTKVSISITTTQKILKRAT